MISVNLEDSESEEEVELFIGGIDKIGDLEEVKSELKKFGDFKDFKCIVDKRNTMRGYAFIKVTKYNLHSFLGKELKLNNCRLFINRALKKI